MTISPPNENILIIMLKEEGDDYEVSYSQHERATLCPLGELVGDEGEAIKAVLAEYGHGVKISYVNGVLDKLFQQGISLGNIALALSMGTEHDAAHRLLAEAADLLNGCDIYPSLAVVPDEEEGE